MSRRDATNLFANPTLTGPADEHGLPAGWSLAAYEHGVHYWKLPVRVEAQVDVLGDGGPDGGPAIRIGHQKFRLLDPWDDYLPEPGFVRWVGVEPAMTPVAPAPVDRLFTLVYHGRSRGDGYVHARISGPHLQNDPESIAWTKRWRRIEHTFVLEAHETLEAVRFFVSVSGRTDAVELAGFELTCDGEFKPVSLKPRSRLQELPEPNDDTVIHVNPPSFAWPDEGELARYEVELSPTDDFSHDVRRFGPLNFNFFKLPTLLEPGRWFWRHRTTGGAFSAPVAFTMPAGCVEYVTPAFDEVFADLRRDHPRLFVNRDTLDALRRTVTVAHADAWRTFVERIDEPYAWFVERRRRRQEHDVGWRAMMLEGYAFAWLVAEKPEHARQAHTLLAELLDVPFTGVTQHRHSELNRNVVNALSCCYDWMHECLSDDERRRTREAIARRVEDIYLHYRRGPDPWYSFERFRYDSHATYMMQTVLWGALAIADEVPEAKRWMEYWLTAGISYYPPWSETDGSWAQGTGYCSPYVDHNDIPEARMVRSAAGLDLFRKPFFRNHRDFILYAYPPFGLKAPFGDLGGKDGPHDNDLIRFARMAAVLAAEFDDPYAAWYARVATPLKGFHPMIALQVPEATVPPKPPTDLPLAKLFPDTGWALLHTDLTGRDDIFFAFKSSPFGSLSHSHADQNSFTLSVGDRRLLTDSGYYAGYGTPHHLGFYKHSKAHNTILVDGRGQLVNAIKAAGHVTHFAHTGDIDYVVGDAQAAYGNRLRRFDRHVVFLRPNLFVILDDVESAEPSTVEWLLHSPLPFVIDREAGLVSVQNGPAFARVHLRGPGELAFSQTDRFDPPPHMSPHRLPGEIYKHEFHFAARSAGRLTAQRFVAFIAVGEFGRREDLPEPTFVEIDDWVGVDTDEGSAFLRKGTASRLTLGGRKVETDARAVVLRPSGAYLAADVSTLIVDGRIVFESDSPARVRAGRLTDA